MGIINVTTDSFYAKSQYNNSDALIKRAIDMEQEGAAIIDVGGESTAPGATPLGLPEELDRVIPVIERLQQVVGIPISIDTYKPTVMTEAIKAGANMINDVNALREEGAIEAVIQGNVPVVLMHMLGNPETINISPTYNNVIQEIYDFLSERIQQCTDAGISRKRIIIDPGFGGGKFGKTVAHNCEIIQKLDSFNSLSLPLLVGVARKSTIGAVLDAGVDDRLYGSIALAVLAVKNGAKLIRAYDVKPTWDAIKMTEAVCNPENQANLN